VPGNADATGAAAPAASSAVAAQDAGSAPPADPPVELKASEAKPAAPQKQPTAAPVSLPEKQQVPAPAAKSLVSEATPAPHSLAANSKTKTTDSLPSAEYVIGEQDVLAITVWKEPELSGIVVVRPDGKITVPLVNELKVVGLTPIQLQDLLVQKLKPFVNVPQVTVSVRQINSRNVYLIGQAAREGAFPINSSTTVLQLIAEAGGLRDFAKRKRIYVIRKEGQKQVRYPFDYDAAIRGRNPKQNIVLQPGDMVIVP
jgi:polysaccharide export outer membrane protein